MRRIQWGFDQIRIQEKYRSSSGFGSSHFQRNFSVYSTDDCFAVNNSTTQFLYPYYLWIWIRIQVAQNQGDPEPNPDPKNYFKHKKRYQSSILFLKCLRSRGVPVGGRLRPGRGGLVEVGQIKQTY